MKKITIGSVTKLTLIVLYFTITLQSACQNKVKLNHTTTLDSLKGEWILKMDTSQRIVFQRDTMIMYDHSEEEFKNKIYLSRHSIKKSSELTIGMKDGRYLIAAASHVDFLYQYVIDSLTSKTLLLWYRHKGEPLEYFRRLK